MIKLEKLTLHNFLSFREAEIPLDNLGLCLIAGQNLDENDSNGAGKTTIAAAICWTLFGRTIKGLQADDVINWQIKKDCYVSLGMKVNELSVVVTRYRKYGDIGGAVHVQIEDDIHEGKLTEMQVLINNLLGFDYETFINTTVYSSDTAQMLGSATDAQRRAIFTKLLDLTRFERAHKLAQDKTKAIKEKRHTATAELELIIARSKALEEEIKYAKEREKNYEQEKGQKIQELEDEIKGVVGASPVKSLRRQHATLSSECDLDAAATAEKKASILLGERRYLETQLKELMSKEVLDVCPTCKRGYSEAERRQATKTVQEAMEVTNRELEEKHKAFKEAQETIFEFEKVRTKLFEVDKEIQERERHNERREYRIEGITRKLEDLKGEGNPHSEGIREAESRIAGADQRKREADAAVGVANSQLRFAGVIEDIYSKKGIPSFIMENSFSYLEDKANEYLGVLSGGSISVGIESERELASGEKKEEITLRILKGDQETKYENLSDGERQRLNSALLLALNSYSRTNTGIDFLVLDEILDLSLDASGQERVMELLHKIVSSGELGTVLVISHKQDLKNGFDNTITVEKRNGQSRIADIQDAP